MASEGQELGRIQRALAGPSWSPRGQDGLSGEVGQLRGSLMPGGTGAQAKALGGRGMKGSSWSQEVWDWGHIAQPGWLRVMGL